ncbi:hypothetical protein [Streptomyces mirabilis]|uniref:hypothetical protein n=1 Tax=Streptomyces mirabilis TaxID=68239 RepID=UPI0033F16279
MTIDPAWIADRDSNQLAGVWQVNATVKANDGDYWTVTTGNVGQMTTQVTATSAGSWRWYFAGTTTTSLKVPAGDTLDLK